MKNLCLVIALLSSVACSALKQVTPTESVRTDVRIETVTVKDTVFLEIPLIEKVVETLDTASVIENKYAKSAAKVSGGVLVHSLQTKPVSEPVIIDKQIVYRDSLVFVDRINEVKVEVEKPLSWWQRLKLTLGGIAIVALIIWIAYTIIHFLFTQKLISL